MPGLGPARSAARRATASRNRLAAEKPRVTRLGLEAWAAAVPAASPKTTPGRATPSEVPRPRVGLRIPLAMPDLVRGTEAMIEALLGGVIAPKPTPATASSSPAGPTIARPASIKAMT